MCVSNLTFQSRKQSLVLTTAIDEGMVTVKCHIQRNNHNPTIEDNHCYSNNINLSSVTW